MTPGDDPCQNPTAPLPLANQRTPTITLATVHTVVLRQAPGTQHAAGEAITISLLTLPGWKKGDPGLEQSPGVLWVWQQEAHRKKSVLILFTCEDSDVKALSRGYPIEIQIMKQKLFKHSTDHRVHCIQGMLCSIWRAKHTPDTPQCSSQDTVTHGTCCPWTCTTGICMLIPKAYFLSYSYLSLTVYSIYYHYTLCASLCTILIGC